MQKRVTVLDVEKYDEGFPPEGVQAFAEWLNKAVGAIPEEHLSSAKIEIGSTSRYEDTYATVEIYYTREETAEEVAARAHDEAVAKAKRLAWLEGELARARSK